MEMERRAFGELRAQGRTLVGIAAPFGKPANIAGLFTERIAPGAFASTISDGHDILALSDHRDNALLGRTRSGTLRLNETASGLEYALDLPATTLGNDLLALAQRDDLGGVSIGFSAASDHWPNPQTRELRQVVLHEVSIVSAVPCYPDTTIALRCRDRSGAGALRELRAFLAMLERT